MKNNQTTFYLQKMGIAYHLNIFYVCLKQYVAHVLQHLPLQFQPCLFQMLFVLHTSTDFYN